VPLCPTRRKVRQLPRQGRFTSPHGRSCSPMRSSHTELDSAAQDSRSPTDPNAHDGGVSRHVSEHGKEQSFGVVPDGSECEAIDPS